MLLPLKCSTVALFATILSLTAVGQTWVDVGGPCFTAGPVPSLSFAVHPLTGDPYLLYKDESLSLTSNTKKFNGTTWAHVGDTAFSNTNILWPSIAVKSTGRVFVAFLDYLQSASCSVMEFNDTVWKYVVTAGFSGHICNFTSLAISRRDTLFVASADGGISQASLNKFDGVGWVEIGPRYFTPGNASWVSLAIDTGGIPFVAFVDYANGRRASVMKFGSSGWVNVGAPGFSPGAANKTALTIDGSGTPYIAFIDSANGAKVSVMKFDGATWVDVGGPGISPGIANLGRRCIVTDNSGNPYLVYSDGSAGSKITVVQFSGGAWHTVGMPAFSAGATANAEIALSSAGIPYVAFSDSTDMARARVMMYAPPTASQQIEIPGGLAIIYPNPAVNGITVAAAYSIESIVITNLLGQPMFSGQYNARQIQLDISTMPPGQYLIKVNNTECRG